METNDKRPVMPEHQRGDISLARIHKDTKLLTRRQKNLVDLLQTGAYSAADISICLGYSDPRSYIRVLRNKGVNIQDYWVQTPEVRFKKYFIKNY